MAIFKKIVVFVSLLLLLVVGVAGTLTLLSWNPVEETVYWAFENLPMYTQVLVFIFLALLPLVVLFLTLKRSRDRGIIISRSEEGEVYLRDSAIIKCIRNALRSVPDVLNAQATVKNTSHGVATRVRAQIRITAGVLPDLNRQMREIVTDTLTRVLGIADVADVKIFIEDVKVTGEDPTMVSEPSTPEYPEESV